MANIKNSNFNKYQDDLYCCHCGKQCKSLNSLRQHEVRCSSNPDKIEASFKIAYDRGWDPSWNRGLTKNTDDRVMNNSNKIHEYYLTHENPFLGRHHTAETKDRISKTMVEKGCGGISRRKLIEYKGFILESTYEYEVAKSLDENNISWIKTTRQDYKFKYTDCNGKSHCYTPDFYLPDYDVFLDPKNDYLINMINPKFGYKDIDKIKWVSEQNNIRIVVLDKNRLTWDKIKELL